MSQNLELSGVSEIQPWKEGAPESKTKRTAAIVLSPDGTQVMLLKNLDPELDMVNVPNWNLRGKENSAQTVTQQLYDRTGYDDIESIQVLPGTIEWKFRKTKTDAKNESAIYDNSVYLVKLASMNADKIEDVSHSVLWKNLDEMNKFFATDGSNGSGYLLWELYKNTQ